MKILSIVTSTNAISFALVENQKLLGETFLNNSRLLAETLVDQISKFLKTLGIELGEIDGIAVCTGPGAFTGLRVGITTAKIISQLLNKPIIGLDAIELVARNLSCQGEVIVIQKACRNEVNVAAFGQNKLRLEKQTANFSTTSEKLASKLANNKGPLYLTGDAASLVYEQISDLLGDNINIHLCPPQFWEPKASTAAFWGVEKLINEEISDVMKFGPQYSHPPNIKQNKYEKNKNI